MAVNTYRARRRVKIAPDRWREPGELVPEAHTWYRVDSMLHTGMLSADPDVPEAEFRAAVQRYAPELAERIYSLSGVDGTALLGAHNTPRPARTAPAKSGPKRGAKAD